MTRKPKTTKGDSNYRNEDKMTDKSDVNSEPAASSSSKYEVSVKENYG